jgi:methionyl-tRNA formyltransferase
VIRALAPPLPGAYVTVDGERVVLLRADAIEAPPRAPGTIEREAVTLLLWATDGALRAEPA